MKKYYTVFIKLTGTVFILLPLKITFSATADNDVDVSNHFASRITAIQTTENKNNAPVENILDGTLLKWSNSLKSLKSLKMPLMQVTKTVENSEVQKAVKTEIIPPVINNTSNTTNNVEQKSAEEQLLLRNLLSQSKKIRTEFSMNYGTQQNSTLTQDDNSDTNIVSEQTQQTLQPTATIRYGITPNLEIYSRLTGNWSKIQKNISASGFYVGQKSEMTNSLKLQNLRIGMNYRLWNNDDSGFLGLFETSVLERNTGFLTDGKENKYSSFRSQIYGITAYRSLEPLVLSVTGIYGSNMKRLSQRQYNPANYWLLQPSIAFNPNDNMTLSFGPQWLKTQATTFEDEMIAPANTSIDWTWSFAWALDANNTLNFSGNSGQYQQIQNVNGSNRDINFSWLKQWN